MVSWSNRSTQLPFRPRILAAFLPRGAQFADGLGVSELEIVRQTLQNDEAALVVLRTHQALINTQIAAGILGLPGAIANLIGQFVFLSTPIVATLLVNKAATNQDGKSP